MGEGAILLLYCPFAQGKAEAAYHQVSVIFCAQQMYCYNHHSANLLTILFPELIIIFFNVLKTGEV